MYYIALQIYKIHVFNVITGTIIHVLNDSTSLTSWVRTLGSDNRSLKLEVEVA